jgi:hypothetical protein
MVRSISLPPLLFIWSPDVFGWWRCRARTRSPPPVAGCARKLDLSW